MTDLFELHWKRLESELNAIARELTTWQQPRACSPAGWRPSLNAYRCEDKYLVCVELAGVDRSSIQIHADLRQLIIRGYRPPPEPAPAAQQATHVLAMEIDYGPFQCELRFPEVVRADRIEAELKNGLLWVQLPIRQGSLGENPANP